MLLRNLICKHYTLADLIRKRMNWNYISYLQSWVSRKVRNWSGTKDIRQRPNHGQSYTTRCVPRGLCCCPWKPCRIVYKSSHRWPQNSDVTAVPAAPDFPRNVCFLLEAATRINENKLFTVPTFLHFYFPIKYLGGSNWLSTLNWVPLREIPKAIIWPFGLPLCQWIVWGNGIRQVMLQKPTAPKMSVA